MELWIRSQDKRLLQKVDNVYLNANYGDKRICCFDKLSCETELGEYKTKERALEVLDEIQNKICPVDLINIGYGTIVYEMPSE